MPVVQPDVCQFLDRPVGLFRILADQAAEQAGLREIKHEIVDIVGVFQSVEVVQFHAQLVQSVVCQRLAPFSPGAGHISVVQRGLVAAVKGLLNERLRHGAHFFLGHFLPVAQVSQAASFRYGCRNGHDREVHRIEFGR